MALVGEKPVAAPNRPSLYDQLESGGFASLASMEGAWTDWPAEESNSKTGSKSNAWVGLLAALAVTALGWWMHTLPFAPFTFEGATLEHPLGVSVLAILLGMLVANVIPVNRVREGCQWITAWCIPAAVVCLGANMDLRALGGIGVGLFALVIGLMLVAIAVAYTTGKWFGMSSRAAYLLGIGTAVCGSSAILATAPVCAADDEDVVVTVGVVNLVGLLAMFTCVMSLWVMPVSAELFGAWTGATIHAVPQVIAAGESHGSDAAVMATLVKLTRVTLLAPVVLLTALAVTSRGAGAGSQKRQQLWRYIPWFVWGFVALAAVRALGWLPVLEFSPDQAGVVRMPLSDLLGSVSKWLLALSMGAIGLQVHLKPMLKSGAKALGVGVITWVVMSAVALLLLPLLF
ncbi:putative sulfate exporter family transporter [Verrucomicrobiaceae bacterium 5K15]|uniref:Sulfate exporter family transporter n=1 Tax=Oceaniferula flava TaxID=2800421 RepID=A0AAE2V885_9BACT|nr:putative sulfate exporter family transporter [Oceaniferula flavus]MBK1855117.1 putative sulfate exporter family transporter [Oceaniferula flavus]MBM1136423.1 putative sulfate exporter family transporter [Oceaniferula flavus]